MVTGGLEVAVEALCSCSPYTAISVLSMSSTIRRGESIASALATNSRLSAASPARLSACVSTSVSNDCNREVKATTVIELAGYPMPQNVKTGNTRNRLAARIGKTTPEEEDSIVEYLRFIRSQRNRKDRA